ncbi:DeoR/GlpR family DNA-binding transcription regulator [Lysinibacter cavernae]|uniref:Lactose phosphotransferase system repressor n=1 Tax=Lysinibacter cavernae TaxID=1640652 RepID=A0A7X5R032_9MICO|nr:DeoR/GlpR family DNA-binding transcription regulator [Lysinibacter cavernae]NIH53163.1 DeoR family fructose operon transcriptional repressor [Lysinibacter cavernae]
MSNSEAAPTPITTGTSKASRSRREVILRDLDAHGRVEVSELAITLGVAEETVRRDLKALEQSGHLARAHGGAIRASRVVPELGWLAQTEHEVHPVARAAAALIPQQGNVFIGAGDIAEDLASLLPNSQDLHVVTNSIPVALAASRNPEIVVYNLGGLVDPSDASQSGQWAREDLGRLRLDLAFLSPEGMTPDGSLTATTPKSAAILGEVVRTAKRTVLMASGSRLQPKGLVKFAQLADIGYAVVDDRCGEAFHTLATEAGVSVTVAARLTTSSAAVRPDAGTSQPFDDPNISPKSATPEESNS